MFLNILANDQSQCFYKLDFIKIISISGDFKRKEFKTRTNKDYYLVASRMDTFIPAGTNVTIFGQLPNRRWRCLVEMDELIKTMNSLVQDLDTATAPPKDHKRNSKISLESVTTKKQQQDSAFLENRRNNIPSSYPLIGNLPSTLLDLDANVEFRSATPSSTDTPEPNDFRFEERSHSPYSSHMREKRMTPLKPIFDDDLQIIDLENEGDEMVDGRTRTRDSSSITEESNFEDEATLGDEEVNEASDVESIYDNVSTRDEGDENKNSFLRGEAGKGIFISKRLRQKGISIIVGSSSSEG